MRFTLLTILFILLKASASSQTVDFKWVKTFGSSGLDIGANLTVDASGNLYSISQFSGTVDFDPGPGTYNLTAIDSTDMVILKQDANGHLIWAKQFGGTGEQEGFGIALDNSGNIYCSGLFAGTVDFDPGPGIYNLSATSVSPAAFICKLTPVGSFLWAAKFNEGRLHDIAFDAANNVYTTGYFSGTVDFDPGPGVFNLTSKGSSDALMLKLNSAGGFIWAKHVGGASQDYALSLDVDVAGNLYTIVRPAQTTLTDFDPGPGVFTFTSGNGNNVVLKLDASGNFVWAKRFGASSSNGAHDIKLDAAGNIYISGVFYNIGDFDPGPGVYNLNPAGPPQAGRAFVCKWDASGNFLWAKNFGGPQADFCNGLALDAAGNVYTTGGFTSPADFDPGAGTYILNGNSNGRTAFVTKLDASGNFIWAKKFSSTGNQSGGNHLFVDAKQNIYTVGYFQGTTDFDPETGVYNATAAGYDIFVHKMSQCLGITQSNITAIACNSYTINNQTFTISGVYTQTLTNTSGCDSIITLNLTIGGSTKADTITACGSYNWQGQTYSQSGNYTISLPGTDGCDSILKLTLTIKNKAQTRIDTTICEGQNYAGHTLSGTYVNTFVAANGCDSIRTLNLTVKPRSFSTVNATICEGESYLGYSSNGSFRDTLQSFNGCDSIRTLNLVVNPRKYTNRNISLCDGQSQFAGGANQTITGIYRDTLQSQTGCDSIITTHLTVHPKPKPDLGQDKDLCSGSTLVLSPGSFATYQWHDQSTSPTFTATGSGKYWVSVTDNRGCLASDTLMIKSVLPVPNNFLKSSDTLCQYDKLQLVLSGIYKNYVWSTGSRQPVLTVQQPGRYSLTVTDKEGCLGKDTIEIFQKQCRTGLFVPTGFTPNGDGKNDLFRPRLFGSVKSYHFRVYNRWGALVFQSGDVDKGWDGTISGVRQKNGVFVWTCQYQLEGDSQRFEKGTVVIVQ